MKLRFAVIAVLVAVTAITGTALADNVTPPVNEGLHAPWSVTIDAPRTVVTVTNWETITASGGCTLTWASRFNGVRYVTGATCPTPGRLDGTFSLLTCGVIFRVTVDGTIIADTVPLPCPPPVVPVSVSRVGNTVTFTNPNPADKPASYLYYTKAETATFTSSAPFTATRVGHNGHPAGRFRWVWVWDGFQLATTVPASGSVTIVGDVA